MNNLTTLFYLWVVMFVSCKSLTYEITRLSPLNDALASPNAIYILSSCPTTSGAICPCIINRFTYRITHRLCHPSSTIASTPLANPMIITSIIMTTVNGGTTLTMIANSVVLNSPGVYRYSISNDGVLMSNTGTSQSQITTATNFAIPFSAPPSPEGYQTSLSVEIITGNETCTTTTSMELLNTINNPFSTEMTYTKTITTQRIFTTQISKTDTISTMRSTSHKFTFQTEAKVGVDFIGKADVVVKFGYEAQITDTDAESEATTSGSTTSNSQIHSDSYSVKIQPNGRVSVYKIIKTLRCIKPGIAVGFVVIPSEKIETEVSREAFELKTIDSNQEIIFKS